MSFKGNVALITGAGAGIGLATAAKFAEKGAIVVGASVNKLEEAVFLAKIKEAGGEGIFVLGDISKEEDCKKIVQIAMKKYGKINYLCNIAGIVTGGTCEEVSLEDFDKVMRVNVNGTFMMCKYTIPEMLKCNGGSIVNIASIAGYRGVKDRCGYSVSKAAVMGLTNSIAMDYIKKGIRCNAICPGTTYTPSLEQRFQESSDPEQMRIDFNARQPMGRLGNADEIAEGILFCASEENSFMTGVNFPIDGGFSL